MIDVEQRIAALEREKKLLIEAMQQSERLRTLYTKAMDDLQHTTRKLEEANSALTFLHGISVAISEITALEPLLDRSMDLMSGLYDNPVDCGIFLVEDNDEMRLAASRGSTQPFCDAHAGMRVGDCLCGKVAETGEMLVLDSCHSNHGHTIALPGMEPHGHIILPLKSRGMVVGVFYFYPPEGMPLPQRTVNILDSAGSQLGIALDNARRYEVKSRESAQDALTGLANRRTLESALDLDWAAACRKHSALSVIMLDLDHFKHYNDEHGHLAGDELLKKVSDLLRQNTRDEDLAVRYGGEEFLVLLRDKDIADVQAVAERIRAAVEQHTGVTVSLGVSLSLDEDSGPWETIQRADEALYQAKESGRNRGCVVIARGDAG